MKRKLISLLSFLFILVLLDHLFFFALLKGCAFFKNEIHTLSQSHPDSPLLFLGASHAQEGFSPNLIQQHLKINSYNLAGQGHNPLFLKYQSQLLTQKPTLPKLVVITISCDTVNDYSKPHLLTSFTPPEQFWETYAHFLSYRDFSSLRKVFLSDMFSSSVRNLLSRSIGYAKSRNPIAPITKDPQRGYKPSYRDLVPGEEPDTLKTIDYKTNPIMMEGLKVCLDLWTEKGIPVLLVDTPEFYGTLKARHEYHLYVQEMQSLCQGPLRTFKTFNLLKNEEQKRADYFRDGGWGIPNSHLNEKGGQWFNQIFCEYLASEHPEWVSVLQGLSQN